MSRSSAIILAIGFVMSSLFITWGLHNVRKQNNFVTVKGLSERAVVADKAWWSINTQFGANTTEQIQSEVARIEKAVTQFLANKRFDRSEITIESVNIYRNNYEGATTSMNADFRISVTTDDISKVQSASRAVGDLIAMGILIQSDKWNSGPKFYYTKFKDSKKEMLAEATKEAKAAANEFAINSNSKVGKIKRANQGVFQILPGNQTNENEVFFPEKIIRVVSTIDYYLD